VPRKGSYLQLIHFVDLGTLLADSIRMASLGHIVVIEKVSALRLGFLAALTGSRPVDN
jgi:hypothetical protein